MRRYLRRAPAIVAAILALSGLAAVALIAPSTAAVAQEAITGDTEIWTITRGGRLYDNWMSELLRDPPEGDHPAYPAEGKKTGASTWRCKECHGWDYRGANGAYGKGSHYTGIKGIREFVGVDPATIAPILRGETHGYTEELLPDAAVESLALFVSRGQIDMDLYIDRRAKKARGEARRGARFFQTVCAVCHGFDGTMINFGDEEEIEVIGTVAQDNPWETLHKVANGQPGVPMVSLRALDTQDLVDIVAYAQTLPRE